MKRTEEHPHSRASAPACLAIAAADDDEKIHEFSSDPGAAAQDAPHDAPAPLTALALLVVTTESLKLP